jgi:hypothetical protein
MRLMARIVGYHPAKRINVQYIDLTVDYKQTPLIRGMLTKQTT